MFSDLCNPENKKEIKNSVFFGSVVIWYGSGSGSSILGWIPIRIQGLMTKNFKQLQLSSESESGSGCGITDLIEYHPLLRSWNSARTCLFHYQLINSLHTVDKRNKRTSDKELIIFKERVSQLLLRSIWRRSVQSEGPAGAPATAAAAGGPAAPAPLRQVTWQVPPLQHPF